MNSKNVMAFCYGPCMTNNGKHNKFCQNSNSTKVKLMKLLNKHDMAHMVIKTSHTLLLRSTNFPLPFSIFTNMKNNQMLMWAIVVSNVI